MDERNVYNLATISEPDEYFASFHLPRLATLSLWLQTSAVIFIILIELFILSAHLVFSTIYLVLQKASIVSI